MDAFPKKFTDIMNESYVIHFYENLTEFHFLPKNQSRNIHVCSYLDLKGGILIKMKKKTEKKRFY